MIFLIPHLNADERASAFSFLVVFFVCAQLYCCACVKAARGAESTPFDRCFSLVAKHTTVDLEEDSQGSVMAWLEGIKHFLTGSGMKMVQDAQQVCMGPGPWSIHHTDCIVPAYRRLQLVQLRTAAIQ